MNWLKGMTIERRALWIVTLALSLLCVIQWGCVWKVLTYELPSTSGTPKLMWLSCDEQLGRPCRTPNDADWPEH